MKTSFVDKTKDEEVAKLEACLLNEFISRTGQWFELVLNPWDAPLCFIG